MTKRPLIGIVPLWDDKKQSSWVKRTYIEAIYDAGGIPIILPIFQSEQFIEELNGYDVRQFDADHILIPPMTKADLENLAGKLR